MKNYIRLLIAISCSILTVIIFITVLPVRTSLSFPQIDGTHLENPQSPLQSTSPLTIVINEVAWGGTGASAFDEWIELYNNAPVSLSLQGWRLYAQDGGPDLYLAGHIRAEEYYLIERTDDDTVSDIAATLIHSFGNGRNTNGAVLFLVNSNGVLIDSVNISGGSWPNDGETTFSLERVNPQLPDTDANWDSNNGVDINGLDANGNNIYGTPKTRNSVNQILHNQSDLIITKQGPLQANLLDIITYTFTLSNAGDLPAQNTVITDYFPDGTLYLDQLSPFTTTVQDQLIVWQSGTVSPSDLYTWTLSLQITGTVNNQITNHITCTTSSTETNIINNLATFSSQIGQSKILISAVLYDGYQLNDNDEAVEITNPTINSVDVAGWELCKSTTTNLYCSSLPTMIISPGLSIWLAKDIAAYETSFGHPPDIELSTWMNLANTGGILYLRDSDEKNIDTLVYGDITQPVVGWSGPTVDRYYNYLRGTTGQILTRIPDEESGLPIPDSDSRLDWMQNTDDYKFGRRVWYPGWIKDPFFWPSSAQEHAELIVGVAPDNAFEVTSQMILQAQHSISIEVYTFDNPHLLPLLIQKANEGVDIKILLEGNPVGIGVLTTEWQTQLYICAEIERAGGECWFMIHDTDQHRYNRYEYIHSKMMLIDDTWVVIGTQNYTKDSLPADNKTNGTYGTRGCVIATTAPNVIARAQSIFAHDIDHSRYNDLLRWNTEGDIRYKDYQPELVDLSLTDYISYTIRFTQPLLLADEFDFEIYTAPEAALRQSDALLGLLNRVEAGDRVLVEQMYEYTAWGSDPDNAPNLRLLAYLSAARKGAEVRILLNGQGFGNEYNTVPEKNLETVAYINGIAQEERLNLKAALGNPTGGGIHNKMILVDLNGEGKYSHLGSINGSEGSSKVNREIVLQIKSEALYTYLEELFELDWWLSNRILLPLVVRNYTTPPPHIDHLVTSEVFYSTNPGEEWIEIYNPTSVNIELDNLKIGDAELPTSFEAMFQFPLSSTINAYDTIVIAVNAAAVYQSDFELYESDPSVRNMIPDPNWGSIVYPFSLRDAGDQVLLLDVSYGEIDSFVWGDATHNSITPHPGKINISASLERFPPYYDTNNCLEDFRERYPPTPGDIPLQ